MRDSRSPVRDQAIQVPVPLIHFGIADGFDDVVGQFAGGGDLPVAALEAHVFIGGDHDGPIAAIAADDDGLGQCHILIPADFLAELSRGYADHVSLSCFPDNSGYGVSTG